jgi:Outer membrane protein and related peptidoglycan-associated (lipo)proteins
MRTGKLAGGLVMAALTTTLLSCSAGPPPRDIAEARLALQDAKNAGADQRATREYDAASAHFNVAQSTWNKQKDAVVAAHWARLAQAEARQAQYLSEAAAAQEMVSRETERRQRGELAVREAEIAMLQARARTEAEKRAVEIEVRAAQERRRTEEELARREAEARERERLRSESEARLQAERAKAEQEAAARTQVERDRGAAEIEKMKADLEATRKAAEEAQKAAELERQRLEEQRKAEEVRAAELAKARAGQQQAEEALKTTLSQLGQVREEARGLIVTLPGSIYFDVNKSEVKPAMRERLAEIAKALATVGNRRVLVEGHTDSIGADEYNLKLSRLRAESVRSILIAGGVSADRIESQGYGKTRPVASNATASGKAQNRRVEIVIQGAVVAPVR